MWEKIYNPQFQEDACDELVHMVHTTSTTLTPSLWINTTHALGMRTSRGKGGGTIAHPEIAEMFRAWLFPEFMLELVQWYRSFCHGTSNKAVGHVEHALHLAAKVGVSRGVDDVDFGIFIVD